MPDKNITSDNKNFLIYAKCKCGKQNEYVLTTSKEYACEECDQLVFSLNSYEGFVYIIINQQMPGIVKIGYTNREVEDRTRELSQATGVPRPFQVAAYFYAYHGQVDERKVHKALSENRLPEREFFNLSPGEAILRTIEILKSDPVKVFSNEVRNIESKWGELQAGAGSNVVDESKLNKLISVKSRDGVCPKCDLEMRKLKKGGWKCRKCGSIYRA